MNKPVPVTGTPKVPMHKRLAAGEQLNGQSLAPKAVKRPTAPKTSA